MPVLVKLTFKTPEGKLLDSNGFNELYFPDEDDPEEISEDILCIKAEAELRERKLFEGVAFDMDYESSQLILH